MIFLTNEMFFLKFFGNNYLNNFHDFCGFLHFFLQNRREIHLSKIFVNLNSLILMHRNVNRTYLLPHSAYLKLQFINIMSDLISLILSFKFTSLFHKKLVNSLIFKSQMPQSWDSWALLISGQMLIETAAN
jgi:hypothetical protein